MPTSLAFALLRLLPSDERAVYLLRRIFRCEYSEIAGILRRDEVTCRETFERARKRLDAVRPSLERQSPN